MPSTLANNIEYFLFSFHNISEALAALSKVEHLKGSRLIPLPTEIGTGCGYCLRVDKDLINEAMEILTKDNYENSYSLGHDGKKREIKEYVFW